MVGITFDAMLENEKSVVDASYIMELRVETKRRPEKVEIQVIDYGIGQDSEVKDKIFEPFCYNKVQQKSTTKPSGSGLGLGL